MGTGVLVVEDNPHSLELMSYLLDTAGYTVHCAQTGAEAIRLAETEHVDVVLLDLQLPDIDGYQVLRLLRAQPRVAAVNVVAVTAVAMVGDRERTLAAGFDHYMPKPTNPRTFVAEIATWLPPPTR